MATAQQPAAQSLQDRFFQAEQAVQRGDLQQAVTICKSLIDQHESYAPAYYLLASIYMKIHQYERALSFNEFALRFMPNSFDVYFQRGKIFFVLSRWDDAAAAFARAHTIDPSNAMTIMLQGDVLSQQQRFDEAIVKFDAALRAQDLPEIYEHKGLCLLSSGDPEGARQAFMTLLERLPNYASAHVNLAKIDFSEGDEDKAEERLRKAVMLEPKHHEALSLLTVLLHQRHDNAEAVEFGRRAIATGSYSVMTTLMAIRPLLAAGFLDEVEAVLWRLYEAFPNHLQLIVRLATILAPRGKREQALDLVEKALLQQPDNVSMLHTRAALKGETTATAPEEYVAYLFDGYAEQFDYHLQDQLGYHTPQLIADAVRAALPAGKTDASLLDLGCGTGLAAEALKGVTQHRVGVDLSEKMIAKAKSKGIYAQAYVDELVRFMRGNDTLYDLVVAADVLVYIGDLDALFEQAAARLKPGGLFALSVEREESDAHYALRPSGRYAHAESYLRELAQRHGLSVISAAPCNLRKEAGSMIVGTVMLLRK